MKRYHIIFKGRVQGVGFRYTLQVLATRLSLTGNCRNLENGDVECYVQGSQENIDRFLQELTEGSQFIRIEDHLTEEVPALPLEAREFNFRILY